MCRFILGCVMDLGGRWVSDNSSSPLVAAGCTQGTLWWRLPATPVQKLSPVPHYWESSCRFDIPRTLERKQFLPPGSRSLEICHNATVEIGRRVVCKTSTHSSSSHYSTTPATPSIFQQSYQLPTRYPNAPLHRHNSGSYTTSELGNRTPFRSLGSAPSSPRSSHFRCFS